LKKFILSLKMLTGLTENQKKHLKKSNRLLKNITVSRRRGLKKINAVILILGIIFIPNILHKHKPIPYSDDFVKAVVKVESNGNAKAVSKKGAIGLMQIRYSIWEKELKKHKIIKTRNCLFNPVKNVNAGKYILAKYYKETNFDLEKTLSKYSGNSKNYYNKVIGEFYGKDR